MTEQEIKDICNEYDINNYSINPDGSIDVNGTVDLNYRDLTKIPIKFNKVSGWFKVSFNNLESLENSPIEISFHCSNW
jgi:hypothetical protein